MKQNKEKLFTSSDAWVFACLKGSNNNEGHVEFSKLIAIADYINHAIPTHSEIKNALRKFYTHGFIEVEGKAIYLNDIVDEVNELISKKKGGLFSVINNAQSVLNSSNLNLSEIDDRQNVFEFVTEEFILNAYKSYFN